MLDFMTLKDVTLKDKMDTPAWVKDAVFYQIFPDRFAKSERVPKAGHLEPWDAPPTTHGYKGGRPLRRRRTSRLLARLGRHGALL